MKYALTIAMLSLAACASSNKNSDTTQKEMPVIALAATIHDAVASELRTPENKRRDMYRHPEETLTFFGLQPNMTVVEISPSGGWYTEILAPLLATQGHYIGAIRKNKNQATEGVDEGLWNWMNTHPNVKSKMMITEFNPPEKVDIAPAGTADMVMTFRNVHNWMHAGAEHAAFQSFFVALKPGGILGVVEHRAKSNRQQDPKAESGYVREDFIIKLAEKVGFRLVDKSEINKNPKDTKDYTDGVWTLPPTYKLVDKDRDKYMAIGESDRMTLKFMKPVPKS